MLFQVDFPNATLSRSFTNCRSKPSYLEAAFKPFELMLQGIVLCVLGQIFPILVLLGVVPLYYGARKLGWEFLRLMQRSAADARTRRLADDCLARFSQICDSRQCSDESGTY